MPFVPKNWVNYPGTSTPITAEALEDLETRVTDYSDEVSGGGSGFAANILDYGAVSGDTGDQTSAIQDACDAAATAGEGGGAVLVPTGTFRCLGSIALPNGVSLIGTSDTGSILNWPTDLGAGNFAIYWPMIQYEGQGRIEDLGIRGPGWENNTPGSHPAAMDGITIGQRCLVKRVDLGGFDTGITAVGDHVALDDSVIYACYNGVKWGADMQSSGNFRSRNTSLDATYAGFYIVDGSYSISWSHFDQVHFVAPYGIVSGGGAAIRGSTFTSCYWEACSHGLYRTLNRSTDKVVDVTWINCGGNLNMDGPTGPNGIAGEQYAYAFDFGELTDGLIMGGVSDPTEGLLSAAGSSGVMRKESGNGWRIIPDDLP